MITVTLQVATLLKSLTAVDILLPILQEFRNIFLREHLRKAAEATRINLILYANKSLLVTVNNNFL